MFDGIELRRSNFAPPETAAYAALPGLLSLRRSYQVFFHCFEAHGLTAKDALGGLMLTPFFPVNMSMMKGGKNFYIIGEERLKVFDVGISSRYLNHPQGCLGYRVESENGVFVYATDHEHGNATHDASIRKLAQGADILVYDGQYTPAEYQAHVGWGHSTWEEGIQVAQDADVKELVLFHHDPDRSDLFVDKMLLEARACFPHVHAAIEGTTVNFERQERGGQLSRTNRATLFSEDPVGASYPGQFATGRPD